MSDFGPSGGFARHEAKSGEQGEGQSLREKLSRDRPGSNLCGFCGGEGRIPTPAGLFSGFRGCCPKLVWAAAFSADSVVLTPEQPTPTGLFGVSSRCSLAGRG